MRFSDYDDGKRQLPSLTGLRGLAALWVVLYHYGIRYFPAIQPGALGHIIEKGYLAVDLFFLLSGFVLAHVYANQLNANKSGAAWSFFGARIARLYPVHILVLVLLVLDWTIPSLKQYLIFGRPIDIKSFGSQSLAGLIANVFMLQGLKASSLSWNYPTWSISVEFAAYLLFPIAARRLWRAGGRSALLYIGLFAGWVAFFSWVVQGDFNQWDGWKAFARCIPEFFAGVLLYVLTIKMPSLARSGALVSILALSLITLLQMGSPDGLIVVLFALIIPLLVFGTGMGAIALNTRAMVLLGHLSYALYLIHGLVQTLVAQLLTNMAISDDELSRGASLALMFALTVLSLLSAYCIHHTVELPARTYFRSALKKRPLTVPQLLGL